MHNDEIINGGEVSFGTALNAAGNKPDNTINNKFGFMNADINMGNIEELFFAPRASAGGKAAGAAGPTPAEANEEGVAHNVDDFLDDFLLLAGGAGGMGGQAGGDGADEMEVAEEDLSWLEDPGAFLSLATSAASSATAAPDAAAGVGGGQADGREGFIGGGVSSATASSSVGGGDFSGVVMAAVGISSAPTPGPASAAAPAAAEAAAASSSAIEGESATERKEKLRRQKVARYLDKKKRRVWSKAAPYKSRQRVANARPRHKGRFLPLESEFVPIAELQRRQRALFKQGQEAAQQAALAP